MKLVSINIESEAHLDRVTEFIRKELPDVLCLQEVFSLHLPLFAELGYTTLFLPFMRTSLDGIPQERGIALCARIPVHASRETYFRHPYNEIHTFDRQFPFETQSHGVLIADLMVDGVEYTIATTHFTWTADAEHPAPEQLEDVVALLSCMSTEKPHVLCGDFNMPRGIHPGYDELIKNYVDAIPQEYTSSLDPTLHRLGNDPDKQRLFSSYMVDYLFTQSPYRGTNVALHFGVSDHAAVVAKIEKTI